MPCTSQNQRNPSASLGHAVYVLLVLVKENNVGHIVRVQCMTARLVQFVDNEQRVEW